MFTSCKTDLQTLVKAALARARGADFTPIETVRFRHSVNNELWKWKELPNFKYYTQSNSNFTAILYKCNTLFMVILKIKAWIGF